MKLITKEIEQKFKELGSQENEADPVVVAKYFLPGSGFTWYSISYDPIQQVFFGYTTGLENGWGYYTLEDLSSVKSKYIHLPVERDMYCGFKRISEHYPAMAEDIKRRREMISLELQREKEREIDLEL